MGQGPVRHRRVVTRDIELGESRAGVEDAVGMGQPHTLEGHTAVASPLRFSGFRLLWRRLFGLSLGFSGRRLSRCAVLLSVVDHFPSVLVFTEALEGGLAHN